MHLPLFIARRYLFAGKVHNVINVISAVSALGMATGTAAVIIILSVYNGFDGIIRNNLSDIDPDILIVPSSGKSFVPGGVVFERLYEDDRVITISSVVEENVFIRYEGRQGVARAKGVDTVFEEESGVSSHVLAGKFELRKGDIRQAAVGSVLASRMGVNPNFVSPLELFYPRRDGRISASNPMASLKREAVYPSSVVGISSDLDAELLLVPIETMRSLLDYTDQVSAVELRLSFPASGRKYRNYIFALKKEMGPDFRVLDRVEQHPELFKMMKYEKSAIFLILVFVMIIIAFNIFASLSMLIIEKKHDIATLRALGANDSFIRRTFIYEGWMISLTGLAIGLVLGIAAVFVQRGTGLVRLPGNFLVESYPVVLQPGDVLLTSVTVAFIGLLVALLPVKFSNQRI